MTLWLLTTGLFFLGCFLAALREHALKGQPVAQTLVETAITYSVYILLVGFLVCFNLFYLDRIDPFFTTTRWHAFRVLYWPSWVLAFSPFLVGGVLVIVSACIQRPRRRMVHVLLLSVTLAALEVLFLLEVSVLSTVLVQVVLFILFAWIISLFKLQ